MKNQNRDSLANKMRYKFDKAISKSSLALGSWVALASGIIILALSLIIHLSPLYSSMSLPAIIYTMLLQALAPNPVDVNSGPWPFLIAMLIITLVGIFMVSIFIGIITTSIDNKIQSLRKGRSLVLERGHTVILGWDEHIFTIIRELITANEHHRRSCIVIMGEKDKVEMEDEIRARVSPDKHMEIVCRSGDPIEMVDLDIVSINSAKSIIVLAPDGEDPDTAVIKVLLAIINNPKRRQLPYHIVTEIHDRFNMEVARLVGKDEATILQVSDIIAHIIAQTCRQSGLSMVYTELLNFEGDEIYFALEPSLAGCTFGEALVKYEDSTVIGLRPKDGTPRLNPPMDTVIRAGDEIIAISEDDDTIHLSGIKDPPLQRSRILLRTPAAGLPEFILILGWNKRGSTIIGELDKYIAPGSTVLVVASECNPRAEINELQATLKNQVITFQEGNTADRRLLNSLNVENYQHVVVLADLDGSPQQTDAHTIITLLHLRDIKEKAGHSFSIVSEMLDVRNRNLAEVTHVDDFIVSDELGSLLLTQISENKELNLVFQDLFYPEGSEIFLKPMIDYIMPGEAVNFYTVVDAARMRGEVAIGYRTAASANDQEKNFGVVVNPDKSERVLFGEGDRVIVLAEN